MSGDAATQPNCSSWHERYHVIPEELKKNRQWGLRRKKKPLVVRGGKLVSNGWEDSSCWMSFDNAVRALNAYPGAAEGLVFFLYPSILDEVPQVVALEFDCCRDPDTGEIDPWAIKLIDKLQPFYTEVSVCGTGLVAYMFARVKPGAATYKIRGRDIEAGLAARIAYAKDISVKKVRMQLNILFSHVHVAVTGNMVQGLCFEVRDGTSELNELIFVDQCDTAMLQSIVNSSTLRDCKPIPIERVINISGFQEAGRYRYGPHPVHGSTTDRDFVIDPQRGRWYCFRHQTGGDIWSLIAVVYGIIKCEEVAQTDVELVQKAAAAALEHGLIDKATHTRIVLSLKDKHQPPHDLLIELACSNAELWHDQNREAHISIPVGEEGLASYPVNSTYTRHWLQELWFGFKGSNISRYELHDAVAGLEWRAVRQGKQYTSHLRVAEQDGRIYVDLGRPDWQVLEITAEGWQVVNKAPVKFARCGKLGKIPIPERGGSWEKVAELLGLVEQEHKILIIAWLLQAVWPCGPFTHLVLAGEQGSGKSVKAQCLKLIADPSENLLRRPPRDESDLYVAARNERVLSFDNLSGIPESLSDAYCCLSTGATFGKRQLYTDLEEISVSFRRPCILNGIEALPYRADLLDCIIYIELPRIDEQKRLSEAQILVGVREYLPQIWGLLADAAVEGLRNRARVQAALQGKLPRMADFAVWVAACEPAMPWDAGEFLRVYKANTRDAMASLVEADPLAIAVNQLARDWVVSGKVYEGTARQLYEDLCRVAGIDPLRAPRDWPPTPRSMGHRLSRLAPVLRTWGVDIQKQRIDKGTKYTLVLTMPLSDNLPSWQGVQQQKAADSDIDQFEVEEIDLR